MNLKSVICSGFLHATILGVGMAGESLWRAPLFSKHPKALEIEYILPVKTLKSDDCKIKTPKKPSLSLKKTSQKQGRLKPIEHSYSNVGKQGEHISLHPRLEDHLRLPPLVYPELARQNQQEGDVEIEISLDKNGCVRHVVVLKSTNVALLDQAAIDTYQGKCIVSQPGLFASLNNQKLILPIRFYLR